MAEGLLQHECTEKQMKDLGYEYFHDLYLRSFFQRSSTNETRFVMHDLINDLAQSIAGEMVCKMEATYDGNQKYKISKNLRHFSYIADEFDGIKTFEVAYGISDLRGLTYKGGVHDGARLLEPFNEVKHLRTFSPVMLGTNGCYLTNDVVSMLPKLKRLRVMSLKQYRIFELPSKVGDLKHLRQLDLSHTCIVILPDSNNALYNLQTLMLQNCTRLKKLCSDMGNLINLHHLNNSDVCLLEGMPLRIGRLTRLIMLPYFVVGKGFGSGLGELKSLKHLQNRLKISRLENVDDVEDAVEASLKDKMDLNEILLEWTKSTGNSREPELEMRVLAMLQPHQKLEKLTISGFGGMRFPTWLGDRLLSNLEFLCLEFCRNCTYLPPVGQLPSLKHLVIKGMAGVQIVGAEINGDDPLRPFQSLETLCFEDMQEWKYWSSDELDGFPLLRQLSIVQCPKLSGKLPEHLDLLERLVISNCGQFVVSVQSLPVHCSVEIDGCKEVAWRSRLECSSLSLVVLSDISSHMFLAECCMQGSSKDDEIEIVGYKEPTSFWQVGAQFPRDNNQFHQRLTMKLRNFVWMMKGHYKELKQQQQGSTCRLQYLVLMDSESLVRLPCAFKSLRFLIRLSIRYCPKLVSFPETALPPQLKFIEIDKCDALESLPESWMNNSATSLECLSVESCASLTYSARVQIPSSLKQMVIEKCHSLQTLIREEEASMIHREDINNTSSLLEDLIIRGCPSLVSLWSKNKPPAAVQNIQIYGCSSLTSFSACGNLPKALKHLEIHKCPKLELTAERFQNSMSIEKIVIVDCENLKFLPEDLHKLSHLREVDVYRCPNLVSFPGKGLPSTELKDFRIKDCAKMKVLPNCIQNLTSLQYLGIEKCPDMIFSPEDGNGDGDGFPTNLTQLNVKDVRISKLLFEWRLYRLTSLKELWIGGCPDVVCFPQEIGMKFPTSLTNLSLDNFPNLECLTSTVQSLHCLLRLSLRDCPKLKNFPEKGLPLSLLELRIWKCPLLKERCKKYRGQYWPMIAHIPCILIDDREEED